MCPDVDPRDFATAAKGATQEAVKDATEDAAKEKAKEKAGNVVSGFSLSDVPIPDDIAKRLFSTKGGVSVEAVQEAYGCSDGFAYCVRGVTRMVGVDDVPAVADVAVGVAKIMRGE